LEWKKEYQEKYLIIPIMEYVDEVINNINSYFTIVAKEELQRFAEAEELKAAANEQNYQLIQKGSIAVVRADALERKYVKSLIENIINRI
jgi:hypothetical protein